MMYLIAMAMIIPEIKIGGNVLEGYVQCQPQDTGNGKEGSNCFVQILDTQGRKDTDTNHHQVHNIGQLPRQFKREVEFLR